METILERLKMYFENTSPEQVKDDWEKTKKYDKVESPNVETFIEVSKQLIDVGILQNNLPPEDLINNFENPNFSSDFFLSKT
ncbi:hypothetical protein LB450_03490 [Psychroflexus sp. CAK1W]|uniref:hypothetical protein n=1 Tax=Psychroflexus curvus TaxID=2873595 RepID=UPI001CC9FEC4|nr:hypothetical protein [Psychroflexus curvus]MBZ9627158.1 hypothetical protein [Psychroflexus curvus]